MNDELIDDTRLSVSRRSVIPGEGFFVPDSVEEEVEEQEAREELTGEDIVVISDSDADGLACVALIREAVGETAFLPASPHDLEDSMEQAAEYGDADIDVYVCDLCPDRYEYVEGELEALAARAASIRWFDHHQWDPEVAAAVRAAGVDLVVGESEEECTADVAVRSLDYDFPEHLRELAAVTRDHDLWLKEDPRSDDLADYAFFTDDHEAFVATVREHGAELPPDVMEQLAEHRELKEALVERAVARADYREIGPWTVGITYGRCSQNEVAEAMREAGADASVVVKPAGSASLRGTDEFQRCHEVAGKVGGGGHPKAAGCKPDIYDDMLDYAHHWTTRGATTKRVIIEAFEQRLAELLEAGDLDWNGDADRPTEAETEDA